MRKKKIPAGVVNYRELKENNYYVVDKSMIIADFMNRGSKVTLITRPRRFGKTLNVNMMAEFFDLTKDSKSLFEDTNIMDTEYANEINQYPTIFISFARAKASKQEIVECIKLQLLNEYDRFDYVFKDLSPIQNNIYQIILQNLSSYTDGELSNVGNSLEFLMKCLEKYYNKKVMLFVDEYDTPFIEAHVHNFYNDIKASLVSLLSSAVKDNDSLQYAMLTGIQRVAKENIFSELNNLKVYTVRNKEYAQYFGFTKEETKELLAYYDLKYNKKVKDMYDGYRIGGAEIYNPWSIINYAQDKELRPYWVNTSSNTMIKKAMEKSDKSFKDGYEKLIFENFLETDVNMETSFYEESNTPSLWGLFVNAGYLTISKEMRMNKYRIRIPNNEVQKEFMSLTAYYLNVSDTLLSNLFSALEERKQKDFIFNYENILLQMSSFHDFKDENSYHVLMLGMCAWLQNDYKILSNRESGKGRYDIVLHAKKKFLPSFVMEFKYMKKEDFEKHPDTLKKLAQEAVNQIERNKYDIELTGNIIHIGLAHAGKDVEIIWKEVM